MAKGIGPVEGISQTIYKGTIKDANVKRAVCETTLVFANKVVVSDCGVSAASRWKMQLNICVRAFASIRYPIKHEGGVSKFS